LAAQVRGTASGHALGPTKPNTTWWFWIWTCPNSMAWTCCATCGWNRPACRSWCWPSVLTERTRLEDRVKRRPTRW